MSSAQPQEPDAEPVDAVSHRRRRAAFLRELAELKALRRRIVPRRVKQAQTRERLRMSTYRMM